ncbi:MAG TPA: protein kinase [Pyrinomonadaceae bacterium]
MESPLRPGTKLGRYEIHAQLGAGGMGEVYLAEDTKLGRKVALKILPSELAANQLHMRRFTQEAKAAAALNHPNIAHIYEIGESDNLHFIAMEFVDGQTLRDCLKSRETDLKKILRYLQHVAEALAKAHTAGIVHRDLKPDNIMITREGYAKILDFGLAKLLEQPGDLNSLAEASKTLTRPMYSTPGAIMGTPSYMSPEQAQGKPVDHRSDIFSFGSILYEAVTGQRPFDGESIVETLHNIIHAPAPAVKEADVGPPVDLTRIVRRCLAKDQDERYQSITEAAIELRELRRQVEGLALVDAHTNSAASATVSGSSRSNATVSERLPASSAEYIVGRIARHKSLAILLLLLLVGIIGGALYFSGRRGESAIDSIAVLPFVNQSRDQDTEYVSDGLTESIINSLTQFRNIRVIARSSVFHYKGKETDPLAIGKELGVRALLTGRVMQRGDNLLVSTELIDLRENRQIWGEQYERKISDLLAVQREIARDITTNLRLKLSGTEQKSLAKQYTNNAEAYQLYLKGRFYWNERRADALKKAIEYFNQAIEQDRNFALAYAGLADTYVLLPGYGAGSPEESYPKAKSAAKKALEIDDDLAEAHAALANSLFLSDWNFAESNREFQRAIELNPNYAAAHHWYGGNLLIMAKFDDAIAEMNRAQELDPLSLIINTELGTTYLYARQYERSIEQLRKTLQMDQSFYFAHYSLGMAYVMKGSVEEGQAEYQKARQLNDDPFVLALLGHSYAVSGKKDEALRTTEQLKEISRQRYVPAYSLAIVYAGLNEKEQAFEWLEKSYKAHEGYVTILKIDPFLDNLRSDARFAALMLRVGV